MTEKDKELLLKAIEQKRQEVRPTDTGEMKPVTVPNNLELGWLNALTWMEKFINSLSSEEEQPSEDLEEEINLEYKSNYKLKELTLEEFRRIIYYFANWQKEQTINKASQWLNENVVEYHPRKGELKPVVNINAFREAMEKEDEQC